jgi:hypothetical protein
MEADQQVKFFELSMVDCSDIKSQWQAYFAQRFPINMGDLPQRHYSDKAFFDRNWRGPSTYLDIPYTYENFMLIHGYGDRIQMVVEKKSGKPFKSGDKQAVVKRIVEVEVPSARDKDGNRTMVKRAAYEFRSEEEGYVVNVHQCKVVAS